MEVSWIVNLVLFFLRLNFFFFQEQIPHLFNHFNANGIEAHMYASQWFLTLFTARFPLFFVFRIMDVVLLQGLDTLFQVAIALLQVCYEQLQLKNIVMLFSLYN